MNYPGTAIIGYMRQMLGKSFVVAQYPKGGQARRPCHVLVASRSDLGEVDDPWQHARQIAGEQLAWLVLTEGKAGAVAIHGEEQIRVAARRCRWWTPRGRGCLRRRSDPRAGARHGDPGCTAVRGGLGRLRGRLREFHPSSALKNWLRQPH